MSEMKPLRKIAISNEAMDLFLKKAARAHDRLMRHRHRYIRAWIAATGLHPEECVLVESVHPMDANGVVVTEMRVRRRTEADR